MLKVKNLNVLHSSGHELIDVTFKVDKGQVVGVAGDNSSSKGILGRVIADRYIEHSGEIIINHLNRSHEKEAASYYVGYSPADPELESYLTGYEHLDFIGSILGMSQKERTKEIITLANEYDQHKAIYSLIERLQPDQKKKLSLMGSVVHRPAVVVWDEPTSHLDPNDQQTIRRHIKHLKDQKTSVLVISNDTGLLEDVSDEVIIMKNGSVNMHGTLSQLKNQSGSSTKSLADILDKVRVDE